MNFNKIRKICRPVRIIIGLGLISLSFYTGNYYYLLGFVPLIAGMINFCPLCNISGKCDIK